MGRLRIIAGRLKGRRIDVPDFPNLRPTGERVREALFDILGPTVAGARVLDAYCGTGALGLEAISRGAIRVVFIESDPRAVLALEGVLDRLVPGEGFRVLRGSVTTQVARAGPAFDLIFADPPYASGEAQVFLPLAAARLVQGGRIVLERAARAEAVQAPNGFELYRAERYGRSRLDFYREGSLLSAAPTCGDG